MSYAKRKSRVVIKVGPLTNNETGELTANSAEMANILAMQYNSVFSTPCQEPPDISDNILPINNIEILDNEKKP